jgi:hypothetical protein
MPQVTSAPSMLAPSSTFGTPVPSSTSSRDSSPTATERIYWQGRVLLPFSNLIDLDSKPPELNPMGTSYEVQNGGSQVLQVNTSPTDSDVRADLVGKADYSICHKALASTVNGSSDFKLDQGEILCLITSDNRLATLSVRSFDRKTQAFLFYIIVWEKRQ